ncbi:DeoR/GlpR family DNA-binding transcription regulator [Halomonas dongshanensis]|uniref:DeoR/GlpR family DNA-binding transcription regulator n=1 Tax=Halomonas dongshanensis TaxID=2890835 RepID=A0ABT2EDB7_9GAMM|nr:DeoR/GlpR family DNA-binding transcription regulator [Halomonas dongshanensis]MCS2609581.1 DeoR/GlpR family DNA-binding transcription regulator [Halomonas dongshanensis]
MQGRSSLRLATIEDALIRQGTLRLRDAAALCGVSEMTIRRDVTTHAGPIRLLGGCLILNQPAMPSPYDLNEQQSTHHQAKRKLCARVASVIEEGDTLFIDCGTTLMPLISELDVFAELTVVTYALNVANAIARLPRVRLVLLGGLYYASSQSFGSDTMSDAIQRLGINKALISAAGVDMQRGVSCFHFHEVGPKQAAMKAAQRRLLVVDASKFNVVRPAYFATLDDFDVVVTDEPRLGDWLPCGQGPAPELVLL